MTREVGVQVFTYREFTIEEICEELAGTGVTAMELMGTHLAPGASDDRVEATLERLDAAGIDVRGYYVGSFDGTELDVARRGFALADELGADYVSVDFPPEDTPIGEVADLAAEHNLLVGVHNHGPGARYETVEDVLAVVEGTPDRIGACVDTGHFLRVDETSGDVIPRLGKRVHAVHVKDFVDAETEVVPGEGRLDIAELVDLLDRHTDLATPLTVEYEADFGDPTPAVTRTARRLRDAQE